MRQLRDVLAEREEEQRAYDAKKEAVAEGKAQLRAIAVSRTAGLLRQVQLLARKSNSAPQGEIFVNWAIVRQCQMTLTQLGIEDVSLLRDVMDARLLLEQLSSHSAESLDALQTELNDLVNELYLVTLQCLDLRNNPGGVLSEDPNTQKKLVTKLSAGLKQASMDLMQLAARCKKLRPRLQTLVQQGLIRFPSEGEEGGTIFAKEFEVCDGSLSSPEDERLSAVAEQFDMGAFDHTNSPLGTAALLIVSEDGIEQLFKGTRDIIASFYDGLLNELQQQVSIFRECAPQIATAISQITTSEYLFTSIPAAFGGIYRDPIKRSIAQTLRNLSILFAISAGFVVIGMIDKNGLMGILGMFFAAFCVLFAPLMIWRYLRVSRQVRSALYNLEELVSTTRREYRQFLEDVPGARGA